MTWEVIATIAELVGALGVIVSLLYLAYEVRMNTRTLRADSSRDAARSWSDFNRWMSDHPSRLVFLKACDPDTKFEEFEPEDAQAVALMCRAFAQTVESEFFQHRAGIQEPEVWEARLRSFVSILQFPAVKSWWELEKTLPIYTASFLRCVEATKTVPLNQKALWGAGNERTT